jgi:hypothetical protein
LIYQEALFTEEFERYVKKEALENGNSLHRGAVGEPGGRFIYRAL